MYELNTHLLRLNLPLVAQVLTPSSGSLDYAISMRPEYHQAIIDVVRFYGWKHIIYMYDSHDGKCTVLYTARHAAVGEASFPRGKQEEEEVWDRSIDSIFFF